MKENHFGKNVLRNKARLPIFFITALLVTVPVQAADKGWVKYGIGDCSENDIGTSEGSVPDNTKAEKAKAAVCWDGKTYINDYFPGRVFCTYKNIAPEQCAGGKNPGLMYKSGSDPDPCADGQAANVWLGRWTASAHYLETSQVWDWWFEISKKGGRYQIQTHTEGPGKTEILRIDFGAIEFLFHDKLETHIVLIRHGNEIVGTVKQPKNEGLPQGTIVGKRETNFCGDKKPGPENDMKGDTNEDAALEQSQSMPGPSVTPAQEPAPKPASLEEKRKRVAELDEYIKEWKYRLKKWSIELKRRKDGLRRLRKGFLSTVQFVRSSEEAKGFWGSLWNGISGGIKAQTHENVAELEDEYSGEFVRYKAAKGEEKYSIKELRKWLMPKEEMYQQKMGQRLMEMEDELGNAQLRKRKLLEEIEELEYKASQTQAP